MSHICVNARLSFSPLSPLTTGSRSASNEDSDDDEDEKDDENEEVSETSNVKLQWSSRGLTNPFVVVRISLESYPVSSSMLCVACV